MAVFDGSRAPYTSPQELTKPVRVKDVGALISLHKALLLKWGMRSHCLPKHSLVVFMARLILRPDSHWVPMLPHMAIALSSDVKNDAEHTRCGITRVLGFFLILPIWSRFAFRSALQLSVHLTIACMLSYLVSWLFTTHAKPGPRSHFVTVAALRFITSPAVSNDPNVQHEEPVSPTLCLVLVWSVGHHAQTDFFVGPHLSYYCGIMPSSNCMLSNILYRVSVTRTFVFRQNTYMNSLPRCSPSVGTQSTCHQRIIDPSTPSQRYYETGKYSL
ncbi:hypothetical protein BS47DRAFT_1394537 [Hydnum rufescens UP504]|uniref:Uncharacterized protein n=1 Tax=Hydnum rufescens UP504 TaxID=1448309 RepID=A0A9P6DVW5_9AGAM|nr:hypothetical protein BS47DRAFT_1394537 [Hydnum rufescens UP504]